MNPTTSPPSPSAASATVPIRPTRPPPYTTVWLRSANSAPSSCAIAVSTGSLPGFAPQNTHTLAMRHIVASPHDLGTQTYPAVIWRA